MSSLSLWAIEISEDRGGEMRARGSFKRENEGEGDICGTSRRPFSFISDGGGEKILGGEGDLRGDGGGVLCDFSASEEWETSRGGTGSDGTSERERWRDEFGEFVGMFLSRREGILEV